MASRQPPAIVALRFMRRTWPSGDRLSDDGAASRHAGLTQQHRIIDCDAVSDAAARTHRNATLDAYRADRLRIVARHLTPGWMFGLLMLQIVTVEGGQVRGDR
jgi:hypothetical protein